MCRAWLPSCRYHLFRAIICYPAVVGKTHLDFLRFAADAQDVIEYVLELYIEGVATQDASQRPEVVVQDIEALLIHLPNLQNLTLRMITLSSRVPQDEVYIPSSTREIGTLTLAASSTADLAFFPLCHLLRLFTTITKLSVSNNRHTCDPSIADSSFVVALRSAPRIAGLLLNAERVEETCNGYLGVLHLYHHSSPRWTLRDLWIGLPRMCSTDDPNDIIHHCQESLEELVVSPCATTWTLLSPSQTVASLRASIRSVLFFRST